MTEKSTYNRRYKLKHKKETSEYNKRYYREHLEGEIERRDRRRANKEKVTHDHVQHRVWQQKNRERIRSYDKEYYATGRICPRIRTRLGLIEYFGSKCSRCGFADTRALQFDHINGGGCKEIRRFGGHTTMYHYYLSNPEEAKRKLQLLCANCNWIKRAENKEIRATAKPKPILNYVQTRLLRWNP